MAAPRHRRWKPELLTSQGAGSLSVEENRPEVCLNSVVFVGILSRQD